MPTLVIFIALALILSILLALIVLLPLLREYKKARSNQLITLNVEVFQARLDELKADYQAGRMSDSEFITQKNELERQLLQASENDTDNFDESLTNNINVSGKTKFKLFRAIPITLLVCIPALIGWAYSIVGNSAPLFKQWQTQDKVGEVADDFMSGDIDLPPQWATEDSLGLINALKMNVYQHANDGYRWQRLSDIFLAYEAEAQANEALARAYRLEPADESIAVRFAQMQFFTNGGYLTNEGRAALQSVLKSNPKHEGAQMLMAMGEARAGNNQQAQAWIEKLRQSISAKEGDHSTALASLDELSAKIESGELSGQQSQAGKMDDSSAQIANSNVAVTVKLNSSLSPLLENTDVLFITIQESTGGAPLAVKRLVADDFIKNIDDGLQVNLSDNDAMMPNHTLSSAMQSDKKLVINARISKSGQAIPESGDLAANPVLLEYDNSNDDLKVTIEIANQVP